MTDVPGQQLVEIKSFGYNYYSSVQVQQLK